MNDLYFVNHITGEHLLATAIFPIATPVCRTRTLCCVAARAVLHEDVVERLVGPVGQLVDPHGGDPLLAHGALRVPAVDHTVVSRPGGEGVGGGADTL